MKKNVVVNRDALNNLLSCFQEGGDYGAHFALPDGVDSLELAEWCNTLYADLEAPALTAPAPAEAGQTVAVTRADVQEIMEFGNHNCDPEQFHDSCLFCGKAHAWNPEHAPDCLIPRLKAALKSETP